MSEDRTEQDSTINERGPDGDRSFSAVSDRLDMSLQDAMMTQRAVRRVLPDDVDDDIVLRCIELALKAPTGSNGQNWEFVVVRDHATKAAFAKQYRAAWKLYGGIGERMVGGDESQSKILRAVGWQVENFEDIPLIVVPCLVGPSRFVPAALGQSSHYGSIYPSVQNLLLAARVDGPRSFVDNAAVVEPDPVTPAAGPAVQHPAGVHGPDGLAPGALWPDHAQAGG